MDALGLSATGMEFASEMLIRAGQQGLRVREVSTGYRERIGESKLATWRDGKRHLRLILRLSPHLPLWYPGLAMIGLAVGLYVGCVAVAGSSAGSVGWQPTFLGTILLILGLAGAITGGVLGCHLPSASPAVRASFAWVSGEKALRRAQTGGISAAIIGLCLDASLFVYWVTGTGPAIAMRQALAGLSQGLILSGILMAVFVTVYRVLRGLATPPAFGGPQC